jgi:hypothetical protein
MDLQTYNALMGAASIQLNTNREKIALEFNFAITAKIKFENTPVELAIKQTAQERFIGMLTGVITAIIGMICCLVLAYEKEANDLVLLFIFFLGYSPLICAKIFSYWWHKTKVI